MTRAGGYQEPTTNKPPEKPEFLYNTNPYIPYRTAYNTKQELVNVTDRDVWKTESSLRWVFCETFCDSPATGVCITTILPVELAVP
jgi:hypothetical protein